MLNDEQLDLFKKFVTYCKDNNVDYLDFEEIKKLSYFKIWKNIINSLTNHTITKKNNETANQILEKYVHQILIEYFSFNFNKFEKKNIQDIFNRFLNYFENDQNTLYYFCPMYNFEFNDDVIIIDDYIKIRKIRENEKKYLFNLYDKFSPVKISLKRIKYVMITKISQNTSNPRLMVERKNIQLVNKLKILKFGNIRLGGLYNFNTSENWNPKNNFDRLKYEPVSTKLEKFILRKKFSEKFHEYLNLVGTRYVDLEYLTTKKITPVEFDKFDYFDRLIGKFGHSLDKTDSSEKIVDLVLCLEILLVSSNSDSNMKFTQRSALFIGKNDLEKQKIWNHMTQFYNFRSGQVHELVDRKMKIKGFPEMSKDEAIDKLESWVRRGILHMILFSNSKKYSELSLKELLKKIDQSMLDIKLNNEFSTNNKKLLKEMNF